MYVRFGCMYVFISIIMFEFIKHFVLFTIAIAVVVVVVVAIILPQDYLSLPFLRSVHHMIIGPIIFL